jgi:hypothetical protein
MVEERVTCQIALHHVAAKTEGTFADHAERSVQISCRQQKGVFVAVKNVIQFVAMLIHQHD